MVAIFVVSCGHFPYTKLCINSLVKNTPRELYRLCLIDNGSIDVTKSWAEKLRNDGVLDEFISNDRNLGIHRGYNQGLKWALDTNCSFIMYIANDHIIAGDWLKPMLEMPSDFGNPFVFWNNMDYFLTLDLMVDKNFESKFLELRLKYCQIDDEDNLDFILKELYEDIDSFADSFAQRHQENSYTYVKSIWPGSMMYKRKVIEDVGFFDEDYSKYDLAPVSDVDHVLRILLKDYKFSISLKSYFHHWGSITTRKFGLKQSGIYEFSNSGREAARQHFIRKWGVGPENFWKVLRERGDRYK